MSNTSTSFIQKVFCDISLEGRPELWHNEEDTEERTVEKIKFLATFPETKYNKFLDVSKSTNRKNDALAKALKEKGNKSYTAGDNIQALNLYNQALCFSSIGPEYGIILANRSALWFELSEHQLVESDVDLALRSEYPTELEYKLYERRGRSRQAMGKIHSAGEDIKTAIKLLSVATLDKEKAKGKTKELNQLLGKLQKASKKVNKEDEKSTNGVSQKSVKFQPSEKFPTFSDAVKIKFEPGRGRFAVASRDIAIGELFAVETAFVCQIDKEFSKSHCWNCLICTKSTVTCQTCSGVVYCSEECRSAANGSYHPYECLYTDTLYQAQLGGWRLAYRALTSRPWQFYKQNLDKFLGRNELAGVEENDSIYSSQDIDSFHSLVTHDGLGNKQAPELMMQCHVVVFLLRLLKATNYLAGGSSDSTVPPATAAEDTQTGESGEEELSDDLVTAGRILHHFMRATFYNTHEITEIVKTGSRWMENSIRRIGRVTNPTLALINHACDPNYRRVSDGNKTFGFASKPIRKGQEILDLYSKPFSSSNIQERQASLAKYNFQCECPACSQAWPTSHLLPAQLENMSPSMYYQPPNKVSAQMKRVVRAEENWGKVERREDVDNEAVIASLSTLVEEHHKLLKPPHQALVFWENQLHQALLHTHSAKVECIKSGQAVVTWPWGC